MNVMQVVHLALSHVFATIFCDVSKLIRKGKKNYMIFLLVLNCFVDNRHVFRATDLCIMSFRMLNGISTVGVKKEECVSITHFHFNFDGEKNNLRKNKLKMKQWIVNGV